MMDRRSFLSAAGAIVAAEGLSTALTGCAGRPSRAAGAKLAVQLYSIRECIGGVTDGAGSCVRPGIGLERALDTLAAIGYRGVEFAGYFGHDARSIMSMLKASGLVACGSHMSADLFAPDRIAETCAFNLGFGNNLLICSGGENIPKGVPWATGRHGETVVLDAAQEDFVRRLCDRYNRAAKDAARYGCRVGIHNHTWEFATHFRDGTLFWDYFLSHTDPEVCFEQDVGWTTCAGYSPMEQFAKYPRRSPTLHAKENGYESARFDAILGKPGIREDGTCVPGVDWDALVPAAQKAGVEWYVVECECHADDFSAVLPSCRFLRERGIGA